MTIKNFNDLPSKEDSIDRSSATLLYEQGLALFEEGSMMGREKRLVSAAKKFKMATVLDPTYFEAWQAWGHTLTLLAQTTEEHHFAILAAEKLAQAIELQDHPSSETLGELYWDYGVVLSKLAAHSGEPIDYQKAIEAFEKGGSISGSLPHEYWRDFGHVYLQLAEKMCSTLYLEKATACFRQAVSISLPFFEGWQLLAESLSRLYTLTHHDDFFRQSHESFSTAAHLSPLSVELWSAWARFLLEAGRHTDDINRIRAALEKCERGHAVDPKHPQLLALLAETLAYLGAVTERIDWITDAQNKIERAVELSEDDDTISHSHGHCLMAFGHYFHDLDYYYQAIEKFQERLSIDRTRHADWHAMGSVYATIGKIEIDPDAYTMAARFYEKAIQLHPTPMLYFDYATLLCHLPNETHLQIATHLLDYLCLLSHEPKWVFQYGTALNLQAIVQESESLHLKAVELLSKLLSTHPDFPELHHQLGLAYARLGDLEGESDLLHKATHHFQIAWQQNPEGELTLIEWATTLINIAHCSFEQEIFLKQAEEKLLLAIHLGNEEAFYYLGCLYSLLGELDQALFFLKKSKAAQTLPPIEELLDDDWLENVRVTPLFQEFLSSLEL